jgi:hypothetical protein
MSLVDEALSFFEGRFDWHDRDDGGASASRVTSGA